jgi:cytochrome oxidase assembly protein ShyY1
VTTAARPYWRRLLIPAIFTIISLAILISLGVWQLQRKAWKEGLIARLEQRLSAPPIDLPPPQEWHQLKQQDAEFKRVRVRVTVPDDARPAWFFSGASALRPDVKGPGYFVFVPGRLPSGATVVIDAGYVPKLQHPPIAGTTEIVGFMRWPEQAGLFISEHDTSGDTWFVRDHLSMARARRWGEVAPFYIDQEAPVPPEGFPKPGPLTVKLKNDHLGYAITWFGLAASLLAVFLVWAAKERYNKTS